MSESIPIHIHIHIHVARYMYIMKGLEKGPDERVDTCGCVTTYQLDKGSNLQSLEYLIFSKSIIYREKWLVKYFFSLNYFKTTSSQTAALDIHSSNSLESCKL